MLEKGKKLIFRLSAVLMVMFSKELLYSYRGARSGKIFVSELFGVLH